VTKKIETILTFKVRLKIPTGCSVPEAQQYIRDALQSHGGGGRPEDPFFNLSKDDFTVSILKKETNYG
jgi:hypothetical protein